MYLHIYIAEGTVDIAVVDLLKRKAPFSSYFLHIRPKESTFLCQTLQTQIPQSYSNFD